MDTAKFENDQSEKKLIKSHALHTEMGKANFIQLGIKSSFQNSLLKVLCPFCSQPHIL